MDRIVQCELPREEARGLRPLARWHVVQQVELVEKPFVITEYRARRYRDPRTGRIVIASLPPEVAAAGLVGPRLSAAIAFQKAACHMSYTTIHSFWRDLAGLDLSRGQLAKVVQKVSAAIRGPYEELRDRLAGQDRLGIDESGHKDAGRRHWTWCFRAPRFTVFHIDRSRGSEVLRTVLGETFGGVIGCDYFSAYRKYMADSGATVQFCMAHLIRDIRFLAEQPNKSAARWAEKLLGWLRKLFHTLHRKAQWPLEKFALRMEAIRRGFLQQVRHPPTWNEARTSGRSLSRSEGGTLLQLPHRAGRGADEQPDRAGNPSCGDRPASDPRHARAARECAGANGHGLRWPLVPNKAAAHSNSFTPHSSPTSPPNPPRPCWRKAVNGYLNRSVIANLEYGLVYYYFGGYLPPRGSGSGEYGPVNHMFPLTPVELHRGWVLGRERLITCLSGKYHWPGSEPPKIFLFDRVGREKSQKFPVRHAGDAYEVEVTLDDWHEIAVLER